MKILLVSGSLPPMQCGVGDYTYQLSKALSQQPDTAIASLSSAGANVPDNKIELLDPISDWRLKSLLHIIKIIRSWNPDIVHIQYPTQGYGIGYNPSWIPLAVRICTRAKVVQTWHESIGRLRTALRYLAAAITFGPIIVVRPRYYDNNHWLIKLVTRRSKYHIINNASSIPYANISEIEKNKIRNNYIINQKRLIVFFGFFNQSKGVELLFDIANPETDQLLLIGDSDPSDPYRKTVESLASSPVWEGKVTFTGFLSPEIVAQLLASADAVILPFRAGGGAWNSSIHASVKQGTFVVTSSRKSRGLDEAMNVYFAEPGNVPEMRDALNKYSGFKVKTNSADEWFNIAEKHINIYKKTK